MRHLVLALACSLAPIPSFAQDPVSRSIAQQWEGAKENILASADQMPEGDYGFTPVPTVRSFGGILAHIAGANYVFCAAAMGQKSPHAEDHFEKTVKAKPDVVKALRDSMAYCDKAYQTTDRAVVETVSAPFGGGKMTRASALMGNTGHLHEHYGNLVTYFRLKGMVPPTSRGQ